MLVQQSPTGREGHGRVTLRIGRAALHCKLSQLEEAAKKLEGTEAQSTAQQLQLQEEVVKVVQAHLGEDAGIGQLTATLRGKCMRELAAEVSAQHKTRKFLAHPRTNLAQRLESALKENVDTDSTSSSGEQNSRKGSEVKHSFGERLSRLEFCYDDPTSLRARIEVLENHPHLVGRRT